MSNTKSLTIELLDGDTVHITNVPAEDMLVLLESDELDKAMLTLGHVINGFQKQIGGPSGKGKSFVRR